MKALKGSFCLAVVVALFGCEAAYRGAPILGPLEVKDPELALGQEVFFAKCHQCHPRGAKGIGLGITNKPLPDWAIRVQVRQGLGQMPAFSEDEISDNSLDALVAYLNALRAQLLSSEKP